MLGALTIYSMKLSAQLFKHIPFGMLKPSIMWFCRRRGNRSAAAVRVAKPQLEAELKTPVAVSGPAGRVTEMKAALPAVQQLPPATAHPSIFPTRCEWGKDRVCSAGPTYVYSSK